MPGRAHVQVIIRGLSIALLIAATGWAMADILHTAFTFNYSGGYTMPWLVFRTQVMNNLQGHLALIATLFGMAALLWVIQRPLSRLIVPRSGRNCGECGYDLRGLNGDRCPECGAGRMPVPSEFKPD